ncbi:hypothetical protein TNCV_2961301 [Trichonephila clavipes]|nr:hypothetical protein TNCV_2961301 [Trichonephila clavipes]
MPILLLSSLQSPFSALGCRFPKAHFNKPTSQKSIGEVSGDFTGISSNGTHIIPVSDSFFAKQEAVDLHLGLEALSIRSSTLSMSFPYKARVSFSKIASKTFC